MPVATKVGSVLVLAVMACSLAACRAKAHASPTKALPLGPPVAPDACAKLSRRDLTAIREAMIDYCESDPGPQYRDDYLHELRNAPILPKGDPKNPFEWPMIGIWKCEVRDGHFVLAEIWRPQYRGFFGVYFAKQRGEWTVRKQFDEMELFRLN